MPYDEKGNYYKDEYGYEYDDYNRKRKTESPAQRAFYTVLKEAVVAHNKKELHTIDPRWATDDQRMAVSMLIKSKCVIMHMLPKPLPLEHKNKPLSVSNNTISLSPQPDTWPREVYDWGLEVTDEGIEVNRCNEFVNKL